MNYYRIPVCDIQAGRVWNEKIHAQNINQCQDKLMDKFAEKYNLDDNVSFREFVQLADQKDILIGDIEDIEEL